MRLKNKVALITGAGSGIGRASAFLFAKEGAKVVVVDIDGETGNQTVRTIKKEKGDAIFVKTDVSKAREVEETVKKAIQRYGRLDILFNNAAINPVGTVVDTPEEVFDKVIGVNLKGVFLNCKYAIPQMLKQGGGVIINTSSINGVVGFPNEVVYDASKAGIILLTKATAIDFGTKNIRVNCILPGMTDTPLFQKYAQLTPDPEKFVEESGKLNAALKRMITPEEVARVALFLASDEASGVTGSEYPVDGGFLAV